MKHLFTTALVTAAFSLPFAAAAQERYPDAQSEPTEPGTEGLCRKFAEAAA